MNRPSRPAGTGEVLLRVDQLTRSFGGILAVNNLSFELEVGQTLALIGPNGAGKTTVFNCLTGYYRANAGRVCFEGKSLTGLKPHEIAGLGIARTFQGLELFGQLTTQENLLAGRHSQMKTGLFQAGIRWGRKSFAAREEVEHRASVEDLMENLGLSEYRSRKVSTLAYGLQKQVALGRALAMSPRLLLLDEPAAGLDDRERALLLATLRRICSERTLTILVIEHHLSWVLELCDRVLALDFGSKIIEGRPAEVVADPEFVRAFMGG